MKKLLILTSAILFIAAACNKQAAVQPVQNQQQTKTDETASWETYIFPNWQLVSFDYPPNWDLITKDANNIELSYNNAEKINIFYKADNRLTKSESVKLSDYDKVMDEYINSFKSINSKSIKTKEGNYEGRNFEVTVGGKKEFHRVFYVGTLLIDLFESNQESVYGGILNSFKYLGF